MKALSIKEPWATMIKEGKKIIETRTWKTNYRGKILLCASKNPKSDISGKAFATAEILDCLPMVKNDEIFACCEVYDRAYSWFLGNVKLIKPFKMRGQLGLFECEYEIDPDKSYLDKLKALCVCHNCGEEATHVRRLELRKEWIYVCAKCKLPKDMPIKE